MNTFLRSLLAVLTIVAATFFITSCKKTFDSPPVPIYPDVTPLRTISIRDLKKIHTTPDGVEAITGDSVIVGTIIADDKSGNFYQSIVIQDETGGILIRLAGSGLNTDYPIGRKVAINCNGLYMGDYNGLIQLGSFGTPGNGVGLVSKTQSDTSIIQGSLFDHVEPIHVKLSELNDSLQNRLIQIDSVEFSDPANSTYADPTKQVSAVNLTVQDCSGYTTILRTSSYATFAGTAVPAGRGTLLAVYSVFGTTSQLLIRDVTDLSFNALRCDGSTGGGGNPGGGTGGLITLQELRSRFTGSNVVLPSGTKITGVVISDAVGNNISKGNVVIQQGNSGVDVYFGSNVIPYQLGDSVVFDISGATLQQYKGAIEVSTKFGSLPPAKVGTGTIVPQAITVAALKTALELPLGDPGNLEYTLVQINNGTGSPAGTIGGADKLTDASGNIALFTWSTATVAGYTMPAGATTWTGYGLNFVSATSTGTEFQVRNASDVVGSSGGGSGGGSAISLQDLRALYSSATVTLSSGTKITGVVISDAASNNISKGNVVIQQGNSGVTVFFGATTTIPYQVGDSIVIDVSGSKLMNYNSSLEVSMKFGSTPPAKAGTGTIVPRTITIADLKTSLAKPLGDAGNLEYTLVKIASATASPAGLYKDGKKLNDGADIALFTWNSATFSGSTMLTGSRTWTGYALNYTTGPEFMIRNTVDVQ